MRNLQTTLVPLNFNQQQQDLKIATELVDNR